MAFSLTPERAKKVRELLALYPHRRAALLPILWLVQEQEGWVPPGAWAEVAAIAGVAEAEVGEVVSFYTLFNRRPVGRRHIQVCVGVCCRLRGSDSLLEYLKAKLGIEPGQTTADGAFTLSTVECLGSCGTAPMMQVNDDYHENLDASKVDALLAQWNG